jgi:hypothetical protein
VIEAVCKERHWEPTKLFNFLRAKYFQVDCDNFKDILLFCKINVFDRTAIERFLIAQAETKEAQNWGVFLKPSRSTQEEECLSGYASQ